MRCVIEGENGPSGAAVDLVYDVHDRLDTVTTRVDVLRFRILHPVRRDRFDTVDASVDVYEDDQPREARIVVGGMRSRRLQWSEDWADFYG